ncbi:unnamed protein product [Effrenium voratum]|nr:unnamed protein product [Effrenium voratum]
MIDTALTTRICSRAMAFRALTLRPILKFSRLAVRFASRLEISQQSLQNTKLQRLAAMEKDLHALESGLSNRATKTELVRIKQNWGLQSEDFGSQITVKKLREALAKELQSEIETLKRGLPASAAQAPYGTVRSAVAASQTSQARPRPSGRAVPLAVAGCGAVALGLAYQWRPVPAPGFSAAPRPIPAQAAGEPPEASSKSSASATAGGGRLTEAEPEPAKVPEAAAKPAGSGSLKETGAKGAEGAAGLKTGPLDAVDPKVVAAVALLVLGLGWWLRRPPGGPPLDPEVEADVGSAAADTTGGLDLGPAEASVRARKAAEVVFENAPKEGQVWDMSASVRGVQGGVQERINQFQR